MSSLADRREALDAALHDKYETEFEPDSRAILVHRRDGSPIARYEPGSAILKTDVVVELGFAADAPDDELVRLGDEALDEVAEPWAQKGFERHASHVTFGENPTDETETPVYVVHLRQSVDSVEEVANLVDWLARRSHFYYGDDVLER